MTPENFCYWLQGYFEINQHNGRVILTSEQVDEIKNHLQLVFTKVTPTLLTDFQPLKDIMWLNNASC